MKDLIEDYRKINLSSVEFTKEHVAMKIAADIFDGSDEHIPLAITGRYLIAPSLEYWKTMEGKFIELLITHYSIEGKNIIDRCIAIEQFQVTNIGNWLKKPAGQEEFGIIGGATVVTDNNCRYDYKTYFTEKISFTSSSDASRFSNKVETIYENVIQCWDDKQRY